MNRLVPLTLLLALAPVGLHAQPSVLVGGGLTTPFGDLGDSAEGGYHAGAGVQVSIPTIPVGLRLDGAWHRLPAADDAFEPTKLLTGALSVVFSLPAVGLSPYMLGGLDRHRVDSGPAGASDTQHRSGYHVGFGVGLGPLGFGAYVEIRWVVIDVPSGSARYVPFTVGLRL